MADLIYKDESYKIIGCCFDVYNELGAGLKEINYQRALEKLFSKRKIQYKSQLYVPLKIEGGMVGKYFLDFL